MQGDNTKIPESIPAPESMPSTEQAIPAQPELEVTNTEGMPAAPAATTPQNDVTQAAPAVSQADASAAATPQTAGAAAPVIDPAVAALDASDADIIEKEWVDQADKIMAARANDPAGEEEAEEDLSQAYLKKRFNIDVEDAK
ncbi:hypothetical protein IT414_03555 [bacterium]|nr:hypothetical protein [bacterium]